MSEARQVSGPSRRILKKRGAWVIPQTGVAIAGVPDDVGAYRGVAIALEYKQPGKGPTRRQEFQLHLASRAGVRAYVIHHPGQVAELLDAIDSDLDGAPT